MLGDQNWSLRFSIEEMVMNSFNECKSNAKSLKIFHSKSSSPTYQ